MNKKYKIILAVIVSTFLLVFFCFSYFSYTVSHSPSLVNVCTSENYLNFVVKCLFHEDVSKAVPEVVWMEGVFVYEPVVNKIGEETGYSELFFQTDGELFFIKIDESEFSAAELEKYIGLQIGVQAIVDEGAWDGPEQSRFGEYIVLKAINTL